MGSPRINDRGDLHRAYDESGEMLMHLQATVDYEHFARALSIGPETMVMDFRPDQPMHQRYAVNHGFLSDKAGHETAAISRIVNAFFHWEFNSAEMLVAGDEVYPIDYANACPDVAVTSLHYYFPWAITALVRWSVYCVVTGRRSNVDLETQKYFDIADDPERTYDEKLAGYLALADAHFESDRYREWCAEHLPHLEEQVHDWVTSDDFDRLLRDTVAATYPPHEHEQFLAHFRGLIGLWVEQNHPSLTAPWARTCSVHRCASDPLSRLDCRRIVGAMTAYTYMLECSDGSLYVGSTRDLQRRLEQHALGAGAAYTRNRLPVTLVWVEQHDHVGNAFLREKQIQNWSRAKRIALIEQRPADLPELARGWGRRAPGGLDSPSPGGSGGSTRPSAMRPASRWSSSERQRAAVETSDLVVGARLAGSR